MTTIDDLKRLREAAKLGVIGAGDIAVMRRTLASPIFAQLED